MSWDINDAPSCYTFTRSHSATSAPAIARVLSEQEEQEMTDTEEIQSVSQIYQYESILFPTSTTLPEETMRRLRLDYERNMHMWQRVLERQHKELTQQQACLSLLSSYHAAYATKSLEIAAVFRDIQDTELNMMTARRLVPNLVELDKKMVTSAGLMEVKLAKPAQNKKLAEASKRYFMKKWYMINGKKYIDNCLMNIRRPDVCELAISRAKNSSDELIYSSLEVAKRQFLRCQNEQLEEIHQCNPCMQEATEIIPEFDPSDLKVHIIAHTFYDGINSRIVRCVLQKEILASHLMYHATRTYYVDVSLSEGATSFKSCEEQRVCMARLGRIGGVLAFGKDIYSLDGACEVYLNENHEDFVEHMRRDSDTSFCTLLAMIERERAK